MEEDLDALEDDSTLKHLQALWRGTVEPSKTSGVFKRAAGHGYG